MPEYELNGEGGNIFWVMAAVNKWFTQVGVGKSNIHELMENVTKCKSYEEALRLLQKECDSRGIELTYTKDGEEYQP